jgi:hypothetical protein
MRDYTKIDTWRLADDLTVAVYDGTRAFPREELYGLTSQLRRAAYSVPANTAEGASRESKKDYLHCAVEKESGKLVTLTAAITSFVVLGLMRFGGSGGGVSGL